MEGTLNQPYLLAAAIYLGMLCGALYSLFAVLRGCFGGRAFQVVADVLFVLLAFLLCALALYVLCRVKIRLYIFGGIAMGFGVFRAGVRPLIRFLQKSFHKKQKTVKKDKNPVDKCLNKSL
ncbi:MAG: hypothetical protein IJP03_02300 [Christensenellaceae bacterium]|nr:hypothetical protein [Christensenellaceae bacterium]